MGLAQKQPEFSKPIERSDIFNEKLVDKNIHDTISDLFRRESQIFRRLKDKVRTTNIHNIYNVVEETRILKFGESSENLTVSEIKSNQKRIRDRILDTTAQLSDLVDDEEYSSIYNQLKLFKVCSNFFLNQVNIDYLVSFKNKKDHIYDRETAWLTENYVSENMAFAKQIHKYLRNVVGIKKEESKEFKIFFENVRKIIEGFSLIYCQYLENNGKKLSDVIDISAKKNSDSLKNTADRLIFDVIGMYMTASFWEERGYEISYPAEIVDKERKIDLIAKNGDTGDVVLCQVKSQSEKDVDIFRNYDTMNAHKFRTTPIELIEIASPEMDEGDERLSRYFVNPNFDARKIKSDWRAIYNTASEMDQSEEFKDERGKIKAVWVNARIKNDQQKGGSSWYTK